MVSNNTVEKIWEDLMVMDNTQLSPLPSKTYFNNRVIVRMSKPVKVVKQSFNKSRRVSSVSRSVMQVDGHTKVPSASSPLMEDLQPVFIPEVAPKTRWADNLPVLMMSRVSLVL